MGEGSESGGGGWGGGLRWRHDSEVFGLDLSACWLGGFFLTLINTFGNEQGMCRSAG